MSPTKRLLTKYCRPGETTPTEIVMVAWKCAVEQNFAWETLLDELPRATVSAIHKATIDVMNNLPSDTIGICIGQNFGRIYTEADNFAEADYHVSMAFIKRLKLLTEKMTGI